MRKTVFAILLCFCNEFNAVLHFCMEGCTFLNFLHFGLAGLVGWAGWLAGSLKTVHRRQVTQNHQAVKEFGKEMSTCGLRSKP